MLTFQITLWQDKYPEQCLTIMQPEILGNIINIILNIQLSPTPPQVRKTPKDTNQREKEKPE